MSVPDAARALRRIARPYLWSRQVPAGSGAARLVPGMPEPSVRTTRRFPSSASSSPGNCGQRAHIAEPSRLEKLPAPSRARVCERLSPALPFSFRTALRSPVPFGSLRTALCRSHVSARAALCGTGLFRGGVFAPSRIAASGSLRSVAVLCSVVPFKRSVLVPNHPVLPRSRRAGVQGMAYRGDGKSAPQPLPSPTGTAGRTVPMNRSRSLRPRSDRIRSETRGGSRSDAGDGSGECRKQQGAPWKAAPPFLPVVGASDSLLSAAGTARSPVRRHSPNRRR